MSSSGADLEDTDTTSLFNWSSTQLNDNDWGIGNFLKAGIGLTIVGLFTGVMDVFNAIITFITTPLTSAGESVSNLFSGLIDSPVQILQTTAGVTGDEIAATFTGFLGPFAFPVGVAAVMASLYLVTIYLEDRQTSDIFPGSFTDIDVPEFIPIIGDPGVQETGEDEDRD
ncbi:hypothetical protein [Halorhabdus sp. CUG00001]|uniref:hypothetical protein n=1 Tax=Halorhabdus sp. CUG00001 TaxID=2600297 RepID=UPI00131C871E|nr:hypothetical protein [Halorhabdus sp. CUG00001]